ncbi:stage II sporulation protein D [Acidilutibacter cellobiosedens]|jgi:stage II sporulation protein D|uniref:Stage II sporulation protein D n=1 Tax=Acidilutibacter cellobiosedens TaxID=2507161 RepID=A0A410Q9J4_9FIRM|nr:stage II sporulation protein D [Acidilutibacter cellobiosedens]MBE6081809.1 stage II sporulation protein D [Tissierellaceae bacterium]QAT60665.1 stage II sporulation protein D [Acidilutibacter cellobiosedens]
MKKLGIYLIFFIVIIIVVPAVLVKTINFVMKEDKLNLTEEKDEESENKEEVKFDGYIKVYDTRTQEVLKMPLEDYVKGVVAAEMPAEFHEEALKAQAVASRTYALERTKKYPAGHPDHPGAPLCTGVHCQAYLSLQELEEAHSSKWVEQYWGKIEDAVDSTKNEVIYYDGELIEPLYHSTSGGMTEDSEDVFAVSYPYLKSVLSPYEEGAPKLKSTSTFTVNEFIDKIKENYPEANITKDNMAEKIKVVERTESGRIKKLMIDGIVIEGSKIRSIFNLNSTNFKITLNLKTNTVEIETTGYGHGVGMSQWGANGMAKQGKNYKEILCHYYQGVEIGTYK